MTRPRFEWHYEWSQEGSYKPQLGIDGVSIEGLVDQWWHELLLSSELSTKSASIE